MAEAPDIAKFSAGLGLRIGSGHAGAPRSGPPRAGTPTGRPLEAGARVFFEKCDVRFS